MKRWKFKLAILAVFGLGILIGCMGTGWWFAHGFRDFRGPRGKVEAHMLDKLSWYLDLSKEQKEKLQPVVHDMATKLEDLRARAEPELRRIVEGGLQQAKPILSAEQYRKVESKYLDMRDKWERRHDDD